MRYVLVTPPVDPPVGLEEAKAHLRIDDAHTDRLLEQCLEAAAGYLDGRFGVLGRALNAQTWRLDTAAPDHQGKVALDLPPVTAVTKVSVRQGAEAVTWPSTDWRLDHYDARAFVVPAYGKSWPWCDQRSDAISVTFTAGQGVPPPIRQAILLLTEVFYEAGPATAPALVEVPFGVSALIEPWRNRR